MIIKSMSRSNTSFESLYEYLIRDDDSELGVYNLYSNAKDKKGVIREFMDNSHYIKRALGKNYLYHEIISLKANELSLDAQKKILQDTAREYISQRAKEHLVFTSLHLDKDNLHIHLMMSSNRLMQNKRVRLSKKEFSSIQKNVELYVNQTYPELTPSKHYQASKQHHKPKQSEQELKTRRGKNSKRDKVIEDLSELFNNATTTKYFTKHLKNKGYEFYQRGKTIGIKHEGKKYRLKTIGLEKSYYQTIEKLDRGRKREEKRKEEKVYEKNNVKEETTVEKRRKEFKNIRAKHENANEQEKQR